MMRISSPLTRFVFLCGVLWGLSAQAQTKDPAAILQLDTTTQGLLPPRMTTAQRDAIDSPPDGLMIYNTDTQRLNFYRGDPYSSWSIASLAEDEIFHNGLAYRELTSTATNEIWLDRNVGALRAPKSISDTGSAFGNFFTQDDAQTCCPPGYRLPTKAEWQAEINNMSPQNAVGGWNALKLTKVGKRSSGTGETATHSEAGSSVVYHGAGSGYAILLSGTSASTASINTTTGFPVRCIKDD